MGSHTHALFEHVYSNPGGVYNIPTVGIYVAILSLRFGKFAKFTM